MREAAVARLRHNNTIWGYIMTTNGKTLKLVPVFIYSRSRVAQLYPNALKREPSAWGYNWATPLLGDINTWTWPSRLRESRTWDTKIWSWVPLDSDMRMTALARTSSNCTRQARLLVTEHAPHQQTGICLTVRNIWSCFPEGAWN
jgi:hypothetical protein